MELAPNKPSEAPYFDAALVRSYWLDRNPRTGVIDVSRRHRYTAYAAAMLYNRDQVGKLVVVGGNVWGERYPSTATLAQEKLINWGVEEDDIICLDGTYSTFAETEAFLKAAVEHSWGRLADIHSRRHLLTLPVTYPQGDQFEVQPLAAEELLKAEGSFYFTREIEQFESSIYGVGYLTYEGVKLAAIRLGFTEKLRQGPKGPLVPRHVWPLDRTGLKMDDYNV